MINVYDINTINLFMLFTVHKHYAALVRINQVFFYLIRNSGS